MMPVVSIISRIKIKGRTILDIEWCNVQVMLASLLSIQYGNQKILLTLFNLVHCVSIGREKRLFIDAETECWNIWQITIILHIICGIIPWCLVFLFAPYLLLSFFVSSWQCFAAIFFTNVISNLLGSFSQKILKRMQWKY